MKKKVSFVSRYRIVDRSSIINFVVIYYAVPPSKTITFRFDYEAEEYIKSLKLEENSYICREFVINDDDTACDYKFLSDI